MKNFIVSLVAIFSMLTTPPVFGQNTKEKIAVFGFSTKGLNLDDEQAANIARIELEKIGLYDVLDKADIEYTLKKQGAADTQTKDCTSKLCIADLGKKIKSDKMLFGSIDLYGESIIVSCKLLDVGTGSVEKTQVTEFLDLKSSIPQMMGLNLQKMFGIAVDQEQFVRLTKRNNFANAVNTPTEERVNLSGPRFGMTYFTGNVSKILGGKKVDGGFEAYPTMFQFGYQFEIQYLNQGNLQAVFEIIPVITGLDQNVIMPSVSTLVGFRDTRSGFEIAFGPMAYMSKMAKGYESNGKFVLDNEARPAKAEVVEQLDYRGETRIKSAFVFGIGKSFKSGKMNIPINFFAIPNKEGWRMGLSAGFNLR
ncbi:MAG: hypothetical protein RL757_2642 [Bacteroidota bacterium]|jgi:hypothetical protein